MVINDTLESIRKYMTKDVVVLMDGWSDIERHINGRVISGLCQGCRGGSHPNRMFGLSNLLECYPDADWYCWFEYDALVASSDFKEDLHKASDDDWVLGFCVASIPFDLPVLPVIFKREIKSLTYALGAVSFFRGDFIRQLDRDNMFEWVNNSMTVFQGATQGVGVQKLPGVVLAKELYDFGEYVMGTLAAGYGKNIASLSHWNMLQYNKQLWRCNGIQDYVALERYWYGNHEKYPIRWKPALTQAENVIGISSILHPLKQYDDPIRQFYREQRAKQLTPLTKVNAKWNTVGFHCEE
jgi:hypothetical protein